MKEKPKIDEKPKRKKIVLKDKAVQTARGGKIKIEVEDLTSEGIFLLKTKVKNKKKLFYIIVTFDNFSFTLAGPSENYWEVLAERRRIALEDALEDNRELVERVETLEEENRIYKEMLDESRALVEVLQV